MAVTVLILGDAHDYIVALTDAEQGALRADIEAMRAGDFGSVYTKQLHGKVRELISGDHRLVYFQVKDQVYFIRGFPKKSQKTPKREIDYALKIYRQIANARNTERRE